MTIERKDLSNQKPPYSLEDESGVVGCILIDPKRIDEVSPILKPDRFQSPPHRMVYQAACDLHNSGRAVDLIVMMNYLRETKQLESVGGVAFLQDLYKFEPTSANAVFYAEGIIASAQKRDVINAAWDAIGAAHDPTTSASDLLAGITQKIIDINENTCRGEDRLAAEFALEASAELEKRLGGAPEVGSVGLPWHEVSRIIGRFRRGNFVVLAARTSAGKSAFAYGIIDYVVEQLGVPTCLFSLEMSGVEVIDRMIASRSGVSGEAIRDGKLSEEERRRYVDRANDFHDWPFRIDDHPNRTFIDIASRARMRKRQGELGFLVIDHIGLIERDNARESDYEHMSKVSRRLKLLARELDIPILGLAQLNRESDKRADPKPKLSDIKASGSIEQDANIVIFLHRPELYSPDDFDKKGKAEVIVAKNRGGKTGTANLKFEGRTTTFINAATEFQFD